LLCGIQAFRFLCSRTETYVLLVTRAGAYFKQSWNKITPIDNNSQF